MLLPKIHDENWEKEVIGKSQREFTNCLTNLIAFYDKMSRFVDARTAA